MAKVYYEPPVPIGDDPKTPRVGYYWIWGMRQNDAEPMPLLVDWGGYYWDGPEELRPDDIAPGAIWLGPVDVPPRPAPRPHEARDELDLIYARNNAVTTTQRIELLCRLLNVRGGIGGQEDEDGDLAALEGEHA